MYVLLASPQCGLVPVASWGGQHRSWWAIGGSCWIPLPPHQTMGPWFSAVWPKSSMDGPFALSQSCQLGDKCQCKSHVLVIVAGPIGAKCHFLVDSEQRILPFFLFLIRGFSGRIDSQRQGNNLHVNSKLEKSSHIWGKVETTGYNELRYHSICSATLNMLQWNYEPAKYSISYLFV